MSSTVAVVGATGYTGIELVTILARHPEVASLHLFGSERSAGKSWAEVAPRYRHFFRGTIEEFNPAAVHGMDAVFLALPHGHSGETAQKLHGSVGCVIDLSGDLRLDDPKDYDKWYGRAAVAPDLLGHAVYGQPELLRGDIADATLISNPGCYATAMQLAVTPALMAEGLVENDDVVITAVSGASGAGRKGAVPLLSAELDGNLRPYKVGAHQHVPEVLQTIAKCSGRTPRYTFVPQVAGFERGILAIASMPLADGKTLDDAVTAYREIYSDRPFVRISTTRPPEVTDVTHTNFCDLGLFHDATGGRLVVISAIDNLVKGAGGQAVQNWNLARHYPETSGLLPTA